MTCGGCGAEVTDRYLCPKCADRLVETVTKVIDLLPNLEEAVLRQSRLGDQSGRSGTSLRLPYDQRASDQMTRARRWAVSTARLLGYSDDDLGVETVLAWINTRIDLLVQQDWAGDALTGAERLLTDVERVVDLPPSRVFLGPCEHCLRPLMALPEDRFFECLCGAVIDVAYRRRELLEQARGYLLNAADLSRALTSLGEPVTSQRIRKWSERRRLVVRGRDAQSRPLYAVQDVLDLLAENKTRRAS